MLKSLSMAKAFPTYRFPLDEAAFRKMQDFYRDFAGPNPSPYVALFVQNDGVTVTLYKPNQKGVAMALFQGPAAYEEARLWKADLARTPVPGPVRKIPHLELKRGEPQNHYPQIGSDEVGTGDVFGPITVCAAYVAESQLPRLAELKVTDSKQMEDAYILSIGPKLLSEFSYSQMALDNEHYNDVHTLNNMNAIKAKMHNRCDLNLLAKQPGAFLYQDQFAPASLYYSYLKDEKEVARGILFHTQGEMLFPSVALASVIARYSFLRKMEEMSKKYDFPFPFGAGPQVDEAIAKFLAQHSKEDLRKVAKMNFANVRKLALD